MRDSGYITPQEGLEKEGTVSRLRDESTVKLATMSEVS